MTHLNWDNSYFANGFFRVMMVIGAEEKPDEELWRQDGYEDVDHVQKRSKGRDRKVEECRFNQSLVVIAVFYLGRQEARTRLPGISGLNRPVGSPVVLAIRD
jgi:hypothetical protein